MTFSELITHIKVWEGFRSSYYYDSAGVKTVGYGFTSSVFPGGVPNSITKEEADKILEDEVVKVYNKVMNKLLTWGYTPDDRLALEFPLTDFAYNCGMGNLSQLTANGTRNITTIIEKLPLYCKAGGKTLKGLQTRRNWEVEEIKKAIRPVQTPVYTIRDLQQRLNEKGHALVVDGIFGKKTLTAVMEELSK